jgi:hypothetical protein
MRMFFFQGHGAPFWVSFYAKGGLLWLQVKFLQIFATIAAFPHKNRHFGGQGHLIKTPIKSGCELEI